MLGKGWFPNQLGGLNRTYRELADRVPDVTTIVIGPMSDARPFATAVSDHDASLARRLVAFARATHSHAKEADVVYAHFALYAALPLISSRVRRLPLVVQFHGPWADENVHVGKGSRWRHWARWKVEHFVYSRATHLVAHTGAFRRLLIEQYRISPWQTSLLPPGADTDRFTPGDRAAARERLGLPPDAFVACCARRLVPRMGVPTLLAAWDAAFGVDGGARLLIAGDGMLRETLEGAVEERSLGDSVTLLGRVSDDDLVSLYQASDVNVVPSHSFEGFGLTVLEAAACGTPSLVSDAGGLPEAVAGLGDNLTVPVGDQQALAARLLGARKRELPSRTATLAWAQAQSWTVKAESYHELLARAARPVASSAPLRVVYLDYRASLTDDWLALGQLISSLPEIEAHVILAEDGPLVGRLLASGVSVEVLPSHRRSSTGQAPTRLQMVVYAIRLAARLRRLRPDIVDATWLPAVAYASLAARLAGRPLVCRERDCLGGRRPFEARRLAPWMRRGGANLMVSDSDNLLGAYRSIGRR
jgi:glycosyltransferase involved in cell wall biosynthesis